MICNLCPRKCSAERNETEGKGFCGLGTLPRVARVAPHMWEEPCISGEKGSGAVFFSGCTLRCVFCQNYAISANNNGRSIKVSELAEEFKKLEAIGVHNINLVTADHFVEAVAESLSIYRPKLPIVYNCSGYTSPKTLTMLSGLVDVYLPDFKYAIVYNSSGYENVETLSRLEGYVDIYLPDFKYADDELAVGYSKAPNYVETATNAVKEMLRQTGEPVFDGEMMRSGVIVRHLVLPNHTKNSVRCLEHISENFKGALVSLMGQYTPVYKALENEKLNRKITRREYDKVKSKLFELELDGFAQELSSADEKYIPSWDY